MIIINKEMYECEPEVAAYIKELEKENKEQIEEMKEYEKETMCKILLGVAEDDK